MEESRQKISFHFRLNDWDNKGFAVEKSEGGRKRRYLNGVSSGISKDLHGEIMTEACINSFQRQAESGDILLYEGQHGVNFIDDIGILVNSKIDPTGNWLTEYRLYDESDDVGQMTLEKSDKLWKQVNGLPPYTKPKQKGFSIEGEVPEGGIVYMDSEGRRTMDNVLLDGVVVVPRPAYKDSVASAVYKALGEIPPDIKIGIQKSLHERMSEAVRQAQTEQNFFYQKYLVEDELEKALCDIMSQDRHGTSREKLELLFSEYSDLMIDLILQNQGVFQTDIVPVETNEVYRSSKRLITVRKIESAIKQFVDSRR